MLLTFVQFEWDARLPKGLKTFTMKFPRHHCAYKILLAPIKNGVSCHWKLTREVQADMELAFHLHLPSVLGYSHVPPYLADSKVIF